MAEWAADHLGTIASDCLRERRSGLANTRGSVPMIASEILAKGVEQGIISAEQAERLRALEDVREPPELPASPDDEQLRFIGGFSDIFVTIGLAMFLGAIGYFSLQAGGKLGLWLAVAITAGLLAEFFTRLRGADGQRHRTGLWTGAGVIARCA